MGMYICLVVLLHTNVTYHITCSTLFELITYFLFDVSLERFNITIPQEINIYSVVLIPICKMHSKQPFKSCSLVLTCKIQAELTTCSTKKNVMFTSQFDCFVLFVGADLDSLPSYGKRPNRIHVNNRKSVIHLHVNVLLSVVRSLIGIGVLKFEFTCINYYCQLNAMYDRLCSNLRRTQCNQFLHCAYKVQR